MQNISRGLAPGTPLGGVQRPQTPRCFSRPLRGQDKTAGGFAILISTPVIYIYGPTLRQAPSLSIFKSNILKLIRPQKKNVFNIHDPKGVRRLFQLRVGLSPLKHHKKRHNFKDTPTGTCRCQMFTETTEHFLVYCNLYTDMFQVINPILESNGLCLPNGEVLVKLLLYGHETLSIADNTAVLTATLKYIDKSSRFNLVNEYDF